MNQNIQTEHLALFHEALNKYEPLSDDVFATIIPIVQYKSFNKGEVIVREGQVCRHYYFIISGSMRSFSLEQDAEVNVQFYFEHEIVSNFYSLRNETPSEFFIVAMEPCTTLMLAKADNLRVFSNSLPLMTATFRFYQEKFFLEEAHSNSFKLMSPEERYQYILDQRPELLQRIPLTHLASYLGISRETLSRIRRKMS